MFLQWVLGFVLRPAATFERAQQEMRFGYWWILIAVFALEILSVLVRPPLTGETPVGAFDLALWIVVFMTILFDIQALFLLTSARVFEWELGWTDALKYVGLTWSLLLVEDLVTFYPAWLGQTEVVLWAGVPFFIWYLLALTAGVQRITGLPRGKALLLAAMASAPWRGILFWLNWSALQQAAST